MKRVSTYRGLTLLEVLVGIALGCLLTTVLLSLWLSVGRYSLMTEQKIGIRDLASHIFSRLQIDAEQTTLGGVDVTTNGSDARMSLQKFSGATEDGLLNWSPRASLYDFSAEEKVLKKWESTVRDGSPPFRRPEPLTPEELLAFAPSEEELTRTWPSVENATFSSSTGRPVLTVKLILHYEGSRNSGYRFETQQSFSLLNGYEP